MSARVALDFSKEPQGMYAKLGGEAKKANRVMSSRYSLYYSTGCMGITPPTCILREVVTTYLKVKSIHLLHSKDMDRNSKK